MNDDQNTPNQTEINLIERTRIFQSITDNVFDLIALTDREGRCTFAGKAYLVLGYDLDSFIGRIPLDFVHPDDLEATEQAFFNFYRDTKSDIRIEYRARCADGSYLWLETVGKHLLEKDGQHSGQLLFSSRDITARRQAEQELRESEARFKALHNASFGGIAIHDKGIILDCNRGLSEISGYSLDELIGMDGLLLVAPQTRDLVMSNIIAGYEKPYEAVGLRKNGEEYPIRLEARNIPYQNKGMRVVEFRDITEQKQAEEHNRQLEEQLRQKQKLSAVGILAGGVAHEINNPLMGIINYAQLVADRLPDDLADLRGFTQEIRSEGARIAIIVRNLMLFSRQDAGTSQSEAPQLIVEGLLTLCSNLLKKHHVELNIVFAPNLPAVHCISGQIQQALLNLLINARDALDERYPQSNPNKKISVRLVLLDDAEGKWVRFIIEDWGTGMDTEIASSCFDPFFTSKPRAKAKGLGLAVSYGIAKDHAGRLTFETVPGQGTKFYLDLPV